MTPSVIWVTFPGNMTSFRQCAALYDVMVEGNVIQTPFMTSHNTRKCVKPWSSSNYHHYSAFLDDDVDKKVAPHEGQLPIL